MIYITEMIHEKHIKINQCVRSNDCQMHYWKPALIQSLADEWSEHHRLVYCKSVINGDKHTKR